MVGTRLCLPGVFDCGLADMPWSSAQPSAGA